MLMALWMWNKTLSFASPFSFSLHFGIWLSWVLGTIILLYCSLLTITVWLFFGLYWKFTNLKFRHIFFLGVFVKGSKIFVFSSTDVLDTSLVNQVYAILYLYSFSIPYVGGVPCLPLFVSVSASLLVLLLFLPSCLLLLSMFSFIFRIWFFSILVAIWQEVRGMKGLFMNI